MIIETEGLTKRFGAREAVRGLSLSVPKGAAVALVGANGAGKTTTLRTLLNILTPDQGAARLFGVDTRKLQARDFQRIGFVSENQILPGRLKVADFFDYLRPLYEQWDTALEKRLRDNLDLPASQRISALSHGVRMKVALVSALAFRPELLVLDEPLSGLDPLVRDEVVEGLLGHADETTILISSHELTEIEGFATDVAYIEAGRLKFHEPMDQLRQRFRAVTATFAQPVASPSKRPPDWLSVEASGHVLRFVDSRFPGEGALSETLGRLCGAPADLDASAMTFRDISKALMRAARQEART